MKFAKGNKLGNRFSSENQPPKERVGRKPKAIKQLEAIVKEKFGISLTKDDKYQILEWILERSADDLNNIINNKTLPIFIVNIARAIVTDSKKGRTNTVEMLFDRFFGKAIQVQELTGKNGSPLVQQLSDEELEKRIKRFSEIVNNGK